MDHSLVMINYFDKVSNLRKV